MIGNLFGLLADVNNPDSGIIRIPINYNSRGLQGLGVTNTASVLKNAKALINSVKM